MSRFTFHVSRFTFHVLRITLSASLALISLALVVRGLTGRSTASRTLPPPPSAQQEQLWAQAGLNDAWYVAHGYTDAPPPSAPSPFWSSPALEVSSSTITITPRLLLDPQAVAFSAFADRPTLLSATVSVSNSGGGVLRWTAQLAPGGSFTPTLAPTSGLQGDAFTLTLDSALYPPGPGTLGLTYTRRITVSAAPSEALDSPQTLVASLYVDPHLPRLWLETNEITLYASARTPGVQSRSVEVRNTGGYTLAWGARVQSLGLMPLVTPTAGVQGGSITITVDSRDYVSGTATYTYSAQIIVSATAGTGILYPVLDTPQEILVRLSMVDYATYLPQVLKQPTPTPTPTPTATPEPPEVRAIWVHRYDWTSLYAPEGPEDIDEIVANVAGAGFNTLFFQVRAYGDAYYVPGLEPWADRLNDDGVLGQDPGWDPLGYMITQAHARGIEVHAHVNVYTAWLGATAPPEGVVPEHPFWTWSYAHGWADWRHWHQTTGVMPLSAGYLWASPGADGVRDHTIAVVSDVLTRYDVDGIHLDRVRYANSPYSYDPISNAAAGSVKTPERDQWQRDRVSDLVGRIYAAVQAIRPGARLSAAVWFCYTGGCGYGLSSGYEDYYQDSLGWLSGGIIDGIAPMLYEWPGFDDFATWQDVMLQFQNANAGRHVYPGISGDFDDFYHIAARIQAARDAGAAGHAIFSYGAIDSRGYWDDFAAGPYAQLP